MLAESESAPHRNMNAFHATYGWSFFHLLNDIAKGKKDANSIMEWQEKDEATFKQGFQMSFITNHDENSWNGTIEERMGEASDAMAVLAFTLTGMPLIYSGQEAGLNHRLQFFEKDSIDWSDLKKEQFYTTLLDLKHRNQSLWNGKYGGNFKRLKTNKDAEVFAFTREKNGNKVTVILNLSKYRQTVKIEDEGYEGDYNNVFGNMTVMLDEDKALQLGAWDYLVLEQ